MELTKNNFKLYAAHYYRNEYCLSEDEFNNDLRQITKIKFMISKMLLGNEINVHLLVNNFITFYNVFEIHAASNLLNFRAEPQQIPFINAVLKFLSFPLLNDTNKVDVPFYEAIEQEFNK